MHRTTTIVVFLFMLVMLASTALAQHDSTEFFIRRGGRLFMNSEYERAREYYEKVLANDSMHFEALRSMGVISSMTGDREGAWSFFKKAMSVDSADSDLLNNMGVMYLQDGDSSLAMRYFERATDADTIHAQYYVNYGNLLANKGRLRESIDPLRRATRLDEKDPNAPYLLANSFAALGTSDSAEFYYLKSRERGSQTEGLLYRLGAIQRKQGKIEEARETFQETARLYPNHVEALEGLGLIYMHEKQYVAAATQFEKVVELAPERYGSWIALGVAYGMVSDFARVDSVLYNLYQVDSTLGFQMVELLNRERALQSTQSDDSQ